MSQQESDVTREVSFGEAVYDEEGNELGHIRGVDEHGFYVSTAEGVVALSGEHDPQKPAGEKELMWRCWECGEMGEIAGGLPDECPNCGERKEGLYFWKED